ncbi:MAG: metalloregulator ArsR/SmtB family transcription factor [Propionibacteriaceae bacterium]
MAQAMAAARVLKALADPVRLRLVSLILAEGQARVGDLGAEFDLAQPTITHHLNVLFDAGLLVRRREGTGVLYQANPSALADAAAIISPPPSAWSRSVRISEVPHPTGRALPGLSEGAADRTLARGIEDLAFRYAGVFNSETIDRYVHESYQTLYRTALVKTYLPLLALRFAAERLSALAQLTGKVAKPVPEVLFVCTQNSGRSQIAAAMLQRLGGDKVHVRSAGSLPTGEVNPTVVEVMSGRGFDLAGEFPKPITDDFIRAADVVITMGCGDACPIYPGRRYLDWDLPDPANQPSDVVAGIADRIETKTRQLLTELGIEPAKEPS